MKRIIDLIELLGGIWAVTTAIRFLPYAGQPVYIQIKEESLVDIAILGVCGSVIIGHVIYKWIKEK